MSLKIPEMTPLEYEARKAMGLWDYQAYENGKHLIEEARQSFVSGIDRERLRSLCEAYDLQMELGDKLIESTLESMFSLEFYKSERIEYHMTPYYMMESDMQDVENTVPIGSLREVQAYTMLMLRVKAEEASDLRKLLPKARPGDVSKAFTPADIDVIKRERFGDAGTYFDYAMAVIELGSGMSETLSRIQDEGLSLLVNDFLSEFTNNHYHDMHAGVHRLSAERLFPSG